MKPHDSSVKKYLIGFQEYYLINISVIAVAIYR